jgi:hypothetical protein
MGRSSGRNAERFWNVMTPENAIVELEKRIAQSGRSLSELTPAEGIELMLDFYRDVRVEGCPLEEDGDMLLFQWGTYDWGQGLSFECDITRQFGESALEGDDALSQLRFTFHFTPSADFDALKEGNRWCYTPEELPDFEKFVVGTDVYRTVAKLRASNVTMIYNRV